MTRGDLNALLKIPSYPADGYAKLADHISALLDTVNDTLLIQGEAIVALEAVATSLAKPKCRALNIVTSPYGTWFGTWLKRGGVEVVELTAEPGRAITLDAVEEAISTATNSFDFLAIVHAESASGILNPLAEIAALARTHNMLTIVDAVASVGGHPLSVSDMELDIVVIGPQKALGGPAGVSSITISQAAWHHFNHEQAPRCSILSIMDQKEQWLDQGRGALPGTPAPLEFYALEAALNEIEMQGLDQLIERHLDISRRTRASLSAGGLELWVGDNETSHLVTTVKLPPSIDRTAFLQSLDVNSGHTIGPAVGPRTEMLIRINHTGPNANLDCIARNIDALAQAAKAHDLIFDRQSAMEALQR
jgi:aspartate aminotransferase-like enzyme